MAETPTPGPESTQDPFEAAIDYVGSIDPSHQTRGNIFGKLRRGAERLFGRNREPVPAQTPPENEHISEQRYESERRYSSMVVQEEIEHLERDGFEGRLRDSVGSEVTIEDQNRYIKYLAERLIRADCDIDSEQVEKLRQLVGPDHEDYLGERLLIEAYKRLDETGRLPKEQQDKLRSLAPDWYKYWTESFEKFRTSSEPWAQSKYKEVREFAEKELENERALRELWASYETAEQIEQNGRLDGTREFLGKTKRFFTESPLGKALLNAGLEIPEIAGKIPRNLPTRAKIALLASGVAGSFISKDTNEKVRETAGKAAGFVKERIVEATPGVLISTGARLALTAAGMELGVMATSVFGGALTGVYKETKKLHAESGSIATERRTKVYEALKLAKSNKRRLAVAAVRGGAMSALGSFIVLQVLSESSVADAIKEQGAEAIRKLGETFNDFINGASDKVSGLSSLIDNLHQVPDEMNPDFAAPTNTPEVPLVPPQVEVDAMPDANTVPAEVPAASIPAPTNTPYPATPTSEPASFEPAATETPTPEHAAQPTSSPEPITAQIPTAEPAAVTPPEPPTQAEAAPEPPPSQPPGSEAPPQPDQPPQPEQSTQPKFPAEEAASQPPEAQAAPAAASSIEMVVNNLPKEVPIPQGSTPWAIAEQLLKEANPNGSFTPADIMAVDKALCEANGIAVPEWGMEGKIPHTAIPAGTNFQITDAVRQAVLHTANK